MSRAARRSGLDVTRSDFYSPLVDPAALRPEVFTEPDPMPGLELDLDGQLRFIETELLGFVSEFRPPLAAPGDPDGFHLDNPYYGPLDAHLLFAIVRRFAPARVLELGSGFSTLIIERALHAGTPAVHQVVDPFPSPLLAGLSDPPRVHRTSAADLPAAHFAQLRENDVLFIDTSHTVKPGGEVVRLVLEVLADLAPGVLVHFHDIFRPFAYPRVLYERYGVHWQEQYLLQAYLADNPNFEVLVANHALWRLRADAVAGWFPGLRPEMAPSGCWIRRR